MIYFESKTQQFIKPFNIKTVLFDNRKLLCGLFCFWLTFLVIFEVAIFHVSLQRCSADLYQWKNEKESLQSLNRSIVVIVADPQLTDEISYETFPENSFALPWVEYFSDAFMRKVFQLTQRFVKPDAVVIAGDMFDGARYIGRKSYRNSLKRFNWIFERNNRNLAFYNLSGNHDIGWGQENSKRQPEYVELFRKHFGKLNYRVEIGGFEWVFIASCLATGGPTSNAKLHDETMQFIHTMRNTPALKPRILMTHVPLYRQPGTPCGSLRSSSRVIEPGSGKDYINVLPIRLSAAILQAIKPVAVFSGDDHDQCVVSHQFGSDKELVKEQTVGTFSWLQGNIYPSFAIVLLEHDSINSRSSLETRVCFLPPQLSIYAWYFRVAVLSILIVFAMASTSNNITFLQLLLKRRSQLSFAIPTLCKIAFFLTIFLFAILLIIYFIFFAM